MNKFVLALVTLSGSETGRVVGGLYDDPYQAVGRAIMEIHNGLSEVPEFRYHFSHVYNLDGNGWAVYAINDVTDDYFLCALILKVRGNKSNENHA